MTLSIHIPGEIRAKARAGRLRLPNGAIRTFVDAKTASAENWVKKCAVDQIGQPMLEGPLAVRIEITVLIPASWSGRKKTQAQSGAIRPTGKPDADNTQKMLFDALNKLVWRDDSQIVEVAFTKRYGAEPGARMHISPAVEGQLL